MIDRQWEQSRHERLLREAEQEHIIRMEADRREHIFRIAAMILVAGILVLLVLWGE